MVPCRKCSPRWTSLAVSSVADIPCRSTSPTAASREATWHRRGRRSCTSTRCLHSTSHRGTSAHRHVQCPRDSLGPCRSSRTRTRSRLRTRQVRRRLSATTRPCRPLRPMRNHPHLPAPRHRRLSRSRSCTITAMVCTSPCASCSRRSRAPYRSHRSPLATRRHLLRSHRPPHLLHRQTTRRSSMSGPYDVTLPSRSTPSVAWRATMLARARPRTCLGSAPSPAQAAKAAGQATGAILQIQRRRSRRYLRHQRVLTLRDGAACEYSAVYIRFAMRRGYLGSWLNMEHILLFSRLYSVPVR